jgi:geranylgeranyl diphosphate synthase type II
MVYKTQRYRHMVRSIHWEESFMVAGMVFDLRQYATIRRALVENNLNAIIAGREPAALWESMRYSVLSGGKRIRALLCLSAAEAVASVSGTHSAKEAQETALACACAIEMVHAMSLIHDDLPCMDNDDFRRGQPTNHKQFGEAMALLAGDALLVFANEVLIRRTPNTVPPQVLLDVVAELSHAIGPDGMVGGQVADSISTGLIRTADSQSSASPQLLESIHKRKTGALLRFSVWSGARLLQGSETALKALSRYGEILGLAFQIADDLLDVTGDIKTLGKTPGKDQATGKLTYVALYGAEGSQQTLKNLQAEGEALLSETKLPPLAVAPLSALLEFAINRTS